MKIWQYEENNDNGNINGCNILILKIILIIVMTNENIDSNNGQQWNLANDNNI